MLTRTCPDAVHEEVQDEDPRVVAALEEYVQACEQGRRPRRSRFLGQYPDIAPQLEECLDGLDLLRGAAHHFEAPSQEATLPHVPTFHPAPDRRLGDYQLVREIGRGGMGIVYEAVQVSLGRRVAIKLLPHSSATDPRQVQRFQVEVQAAARLHHPHIVPVYGVGCEDGAHYYSMQLIPGQPLAALISRWRAKKEGQEGDLLDPSSPEGSPCETPPWSADGRRADAAGFYRYVARLGIQAAEALAHAHRRGIVHRDIKPANLLVDDQAHLWIADFGLARMQGDSGVTATGDLLGTLRYMSPEQAMGRRGVVDDRTDQYSLGATLYELLTGRPAFEGGDLQTLVNRITAGDPLPPGRHDPGIPRDLETIILKAMARDPNNRYATMRELAEDLTRFQEDRPIEARRPSLPERAHRWMRRHRVIVASGAVALLLAVVCLSISTIAIWNAMNRTAEVARARTAELHRAQDNLELAGRVLDLYLNTAESNYPRGPGGDDQENERLRTALVFYEQIASQCFGDPVVKRRAFTAYTRMGDIHTAMGELRGAEAAYRRALSIMEELRGGEPQDEQYLTSQANVLQKFAGLFRRMRHYGPAEWSLEEAVRLLEQVAERRHDDPNARLALAHALIQKGGLKGETGRTALALEDSRRALELLETLRASTGGSTPLLSPVMRKELASVQTNLGKWLQLESQFDEAERAYVDALRLLERLADEEPSATDTREALASCRAMLGELLRLTHREDDSETLLRSAVSGLEHLATEYPRIPRYREHLARVYGILSTLYLATDRPDESAAARDRAIAHDPRLARDHQVQVNNLAWYLLTAPVPAARNPVRGLELARKAVFLDPMSWESWNTLGVGYFRNEEWDEALRAFRTAVNRKPGVNAFDGFFLAMTHWRLGQVSEARHWLAKAEEWRLKSKPDDVELLRFRAEAEQLMGTIPGERFGTPSLPTSIAEALKDPWFRLLQPNLTIAPKHAHARLHEGEPEGQRPSSEDTLAIFDFADHVLFLLDLT